MHVTMPLNLVITCRTVYFLACLVFILMPNTCVYLTGLFRNNVARV